MNPGQRGESPSGPQRPVNQKDIRPSLGYNNRAQELTNQPHDKHSTIEGDSMP